MPRLPILLFVAALLVLPAAQAGWRDRAATEISVDERRIGERALYAYDVNYRDEAQGGPDRGDYAFESAGEKLVVVEGRSQAIDAYGIERETIARLVQDSDPSSVRQVRLQCLLGTDEFVRVDLVGSSSDDSGSKASGTWSIGGVEIYSVSSRADLASSAGFFGGTCDRLPNATTHREGEVLTLGALTGLSASEQGSDVSSSPAVATTFHGRAALRYTFDVADFERATGSARGAAGFTSYLLADGLPGVVQVSVAHVWAQGHSFANSTLVGFEVGSGDIVGHEGQAMPSRHPTATFVDSRAIFDDRGLGMSFPFERAAEHAKLDPRVGAWLAAHPDALLQFASFLIDRPSTVAPAEGWLLTWTDGADSIAVFVDETSRVETPSGPVALPARLPGLTQTHEMSGEGAIWPEGGILSGADIAQMAQLHGIEAGTVGFLFYHIYGATAYVTIAQASIGNASGNMILIDLARGAVLSAIDLEGTTERGGLLNLRASPARFAPESSARGTITTLAGPAQGLALPAAAVTGIALLAVVAKFLLVPLFTRLRRASLLDNPTRARVFERVREHPGIHLAALCEHVGLSESATRHHLEQLARHRYLVELDVDGLRRYYAAGELAPEDARRAAVLRSAPTRAVYDLYSVEPQVSLRDAARRLGSSAPGVHRIRKRLEREGLLPARR